MPLNKSDGALEGMSRGAVACAANGASGTAAIIAAAATMVLIFGLNGSTPVAAAFLSRCGFIKSLKNNDSLSSSFRCATCRAAVGWMGARR